jgi:hypothetical protein
MGGPGGAGLARRDRSLSSPVSRPVYRHVPEPLPLPIRARSISGGAVVSARCGSASPETSPGAMRAVGDQQPEEAPRRLDLAAAAERGGKAASSAPVAAPSAPTRTGALSR